MAISPRTTSYFIPPQGAPQSDDEAQKPESENAKIEGGPAKN